MSRAYLAQAVRNAGVREPWVEDATSDVWLRCWRSDDWRKFAIHSAAVDASRRYGLRRRNGTSREAISLEAVALHPTTDPYAVCDRMIDAERAIARLSERQREVLVAEVAGTGGGTNSHHRRLCDVRKKLRLY
jgi:DNA-directed RNA polymerase specialized sigma24 family protein